MLEFSYKTLENNYYKTLQNIANSLNIGNKITSRIKLPYLLENITICKLHPERRWIMSGISGSGKTTISHLLTNVGFRKLPNIKTRPRRSEEASNENYFVDKETFLSWNKGGLLFNPHIRNGTLHAILKKDLEKLTHKNTLTYLDKSVASALSLVKAIGNDLDFNYVYILTPTFKKLYIRIMKREFLYQKDERRLNKKEIFERFQEETRDMEKSIKLPYAYVVNDSLKRVEKILSLPIKNSLAK
mgnify:CR=1 FL=1